MKKTFILILIISILLILILTGCNKTTYVITTTKYPVYNEPALYKYLDKDVEERLVKIEKAKLKNEFNIYYAKKIISYTDKSVRFIDKTGKEQFISADEIKIGQTK